MNDGAIHDLVLGLDFLTENKCSLNFGTKMLEVAGVSTSFLSEHDLPLKFRNWKGLASSI
ncbi:hypothetical protein MAR_008163 [Mya arenaria]|uniref:Uncharacterized protein n=1 Tax=Mya arenaria TaxID=6604 RepID=A0ABY7DVY3_MYAAR|nr:hypothetical protein MAR_008163 [Mya arenaria]